MRKEEVDPSGLGCGILDDMKINMINTINASHFSLLIPVLNGAVGTVPFELEFEVI